MQLTRKGTLRHSPLRSIDTEALPNIGAEVRGVDLARDLTPELGIYLRKLLVQHQLLVFRRQAISPSIQTRFTKCFGSPESGIRNRPGTHQVPGFADLLYLSNEPGSETSDYGLGWHSDGLAYARVSHGITMLRCLACPTNKGDTMLANQYIAYAEMPENLRRELDELYWYLPPIPHSEVPEGRGLIHPVVRTHPETGRKFVFCSPAATRIRGLTTRESERMLCAIRNYQISRRNVYRHSWQEGDVVVWENCTTLHSRADVVDYDKHGLRAMHRSATSGYFAAMECEPPDTDDAVP